MYNTFTNTLEILWI